MLLRDSKPHTDPPGSEGCAWGQEPQNVKNKKKPQRKQGIISRLLDGRRKAMFKDSIWRVNPL